MTPLPRWTAAALRSGQREDLAAQVRMAPAGCSPQCLGRHRTKGRCHGSDSRTRAAIEEHWRASERGDTEAEHAVYATDAILDSPQSDERFRGRATISAQRGGHPADRHFTVQRITGRANLWVPRNLRDPPDRRITVVWTSPKASATAGRGRALPLRRWLPATGRRALRGDVTFVAVEESQARSPLCHPLTAVAAAHLPSREVTGLWAEVHGRKAAPAESNICAREMRYRCGVRRVFLERPAERNCPPRKSDRTVLPSFSVAGVIARRFFRRPIITATRNANRRIPDTASEGETTWLLVL